MTDDIEKIVVTYRSGQTEIYQKGGLKKFFRLIISSNLSTTIIDHDDIPEPMKKKKKKKTIDESGSYRKINVTYKPSSESSINLASQMRQQAANSGLEFS